MQSINSQLDTLHITTNNAVFSFHPESIHILADLQVSWEKCFHNGMGINVLSATGDNTIISSIADKL